MTGVGLNPEYNNKSGITAGSSTSSGQNDSTIIANRSNSEGPSHDTFNKSGKDPKKSFKDKCWDSLKSSVVSFANAIWGNGSSTIKFLDKTQKLDDGQIALSEPFTAPDEGAANTAAKQQYKIQQGELQRITGELYLDVNAKKTPDGKYVVVANKPF